MATITISTYISAQGELVERRGDIATIRIGSRVLTGRIVSASPAVPA